MGWEDDRGVSEVLGAILLFGILVTAIGGYQAFVVPHQNEQVEYRHDMQVNDEFPTIQTAISNAAGSGEPRTASITLGTDYPFRVFSVGMSPTTGNIRTGEAGTISTVDPNIINIAETCGYSSNTETKSLQYRANYHELANTGRFVYENGVSYRDVQDNIVVRNEQELIDGNTISLYPLTVGSFDRTSTASEQLRFRPAQTGVSDVAVPAGENIYLTLPTELSEDQWRTILEDEVDDPSRVNIDADTGKLNLTLPGNQTYRFRCTPVGINQQPDQEFTPPRDDQSDDETDAGINPTDSVKLQNVGRDGTTVNLTFQAIGESRTFEEVRVPFHDTFPPGASSENAIEYINKSGESASAENLSIGGPYQPLNPEIEVSTQETYIEVKFDANNNEVQGSWFIITFIVDGERAQYFVSVPSN